MKQDGPSAEVADSFIEEWSDCGNMGWCGHSGDNPSCTRHNPDGHRDALKALRAAMPPTAATVNKTMLEALEAICAEADRMSMTMRRRKIFEAGKAAITLAKTGDACR